MKKRTVLALVAFAAMSGIAIMGASGGCGSDLHKAAVASDSIASSLNTAAQINHTLIVNKELSAEQGSAVAGYIDKFAKDNQLFVSQIEQAEASGGVLNTSTILAQFQALITDAQTLNSQGGTFIKNTSSAEAFNDVLASIQAEITVLQTLFGGTTTSSRGSPHPFAPAGALAFAAIALTPEEIEEILGIIIPVVGEGANLVLKLIGMKGESDTTLLNDATTQDQAAEKQAESDEQSAT